MKYIFILLLFLSLQSRSQDVPLKIPYQAVARNSSGDIIANRLISVRFSIHEQSISGPVTFQEKHTITTNSLGLFSVNIGTGVNITGAMFAVNWLSGLEFLQVELDTAGGNDFIDMGTQQMLSVPYSIMSQVSKHGSYIAGPGIEINLDSIKAIPMTLQERLDAGERPSHIIATGIDQSLLIGKHFQGGYLAYISGDYGIIVTENDLGNLIWSNGNDILTGANDYNSGNINTNLIVSAQGNGNYPAKVCDDLILNGYDDWYLPSINELNYVAMVSFKNGGFGTDFYWSSTENDQGTVMCRSMINNLSGVVSKNTPHTFRAVREFYYSN